jgi:ATPase subunit of ABC transporter with duplicated ATPase domains
MAQQFIFTMKDLRNVYPPNREVLKGIWLSFLPGAKIGVLGANGAGKSTLLQIMAGLEREFLGEAFPAAGTRVGYLPQEPTLDPRKDVPRGSILAMHTLLIAASEEASVAMPSMSDEAMQEAVTTGGAQDRIDAANAWGRITLSRSPWMLCGCRRDARSRQAG